ncbi:MAG TPA: dephospho-CoA kinase [Bacteroidia bacterium]|jgi:dephospho-CoA kinase|nr:dephospho-CoA kinase [Bacteroidia bacterium]
MLKIGITGGIGSGKTTICKVFEVLGVPVYYADDASRQLLENDKDVQHKVIAAFGEHVLDETGRIARKKVAAVVFGNEEQLKKLNGIIHPAVALHFESWLKQHQQYFYILKEAAIMFESGAYLQLDKIITITAPEQLRIARVMKRDGTSKQEIERRMKAQLPEEERIKRSQFVIVNDEQELVIPQIMEVHRRLLEANPNGLKNV